MDLETTTVDTAVTSAATKTMSGGIVTTTVGWLSSNEGIAVSGFVLTVFGFVVNLIFQIRRDRREQQLQDAKLAALQNKPIEASVVTATETQDLAGL